jgi:hypothetical protein
MGLHIGQRPGTGRRPPHRRHGNRHLLGQVGEATENAAVVQALIDNLTERGLDPTVCRLFIIDGRQGAEQSHSPHLLRPHPDPAPLVSISTYLVLITVLFAAKITFARVAFGKPDSPPEFMCRHVDFRLGIAPDEG